MIFARAAEGLLIAFAVCTLAHLSSSCFVEESEEIQRDRLCSECAKLRARAADTTSSGLVPSARCTQALVPIRAEEWCIACQTLHGSQAGRPRVCQRALDLVAAALVQLRRHATE